MVSFAFYICDTLQFRLLEFYHAKETPVEYSYRAYMRAVVVFQTEHEYNELLSYIQKHEEEYERMCSRITDLPYFPVSDNCEKVRFEREYREALAVKRILDKIRTEK